MNLDEIIAPDEFQAALIEQRDSTLALLETEEVGSDELSALIKCVIMGTLLARIDRNPSLDKWIVSKSWTEQPVSEMRETHTKLYPLYSTSMDAAVPGEDIVMLAKQHAVPGTEIHRWSALQDKAKVAYLANDRILACRLNGLRAFLAK